MNREKAFELLGDLYGRYVEESVCYAPETASGSPERIVHMKTRRIITLAIAATLILALGITAYAGYQGVATPEAAQRVALEQIEVWKEMGILSQNVVFEGDADAIHEFEEENGGSYWYDRLFTHSFDVRWYCNMQDRTDRQKYGCNLTVDTLTGKIRFADLNAAADENDVPVRESQTAEGNRTLYCYDNFDDIFPTDLTVDRLCTLLAEYWGFSGYTIAKTVDDFYGTEYDPVDGSTLVKDLQSNSIYYLTVFFEGDQKGAPMYIQLNQYPGDVSLMLGTNHGVG